MSLAEEVPEGLLRDTCTAREKHKCGSRAVQVWNKWIASVAREGYRWGKNKAGMPLLICNVFTD